MPPGIFGVATLSLSTGLRFGFICILACDGDRVGGARVCMVVRGPAVGHRGPVPSPSSALLMRCSQRAAFVVLNACLCLLYAFGFFGILAVELIMLGVRPQLAGFSGISTFNFHAPFVGLRMRLISWVVSCAA